MSWSIVLFKEAGSLLTCESRSNTLTTAAALQLLCMTAITYGRDDLSARYFHEGISIGTQLGLFNTSTDYTMTEVWLEADDEWKKAASYTAWGVFNWASFVLLSSAQVVQYGLLNANVCEHQVSTAFTIIAYASRYRPHYHDPETRASLQGPRKSSVPVDWSSMLMFLTLAVLCGSSSVR